MENNLTLLKKKKVLFIEDDKIIRTQINEVLHMLFNKVYSCMNGKEAYNIYEIEKPDLIISDIKMPILDGLRLVEKVREKDYITPIILLTNYNEKEYLFQAANLSIDGYILKPLDFSSLIKTINKAMKRTCLDPGLIFLGENLYFNTGTQEIYLNEEVINLSFKELELLKLLIDNRTRTVTKNEIANVLWPIDDIGESSIKNLILRIRKKINTDLIISVRGLGYRLNILPFINR